jgi:hypothetical protein
MRRCFRKVTITQSGTRPVGRGSWLMTIRSERKTAGTDADEATNAGGEEGGRVRSLIE